MVVIMKIQISLYFCGSKIKSYLKRFFLAKKTIKTCNVNYKTEVYEKNSFTGCCSRDVGFGFTC